MRSLIGGFLLLFFVCPLFAQNLVIRNAQWFDGEQFQTSDLYIIDGYFSKDQPGQIDKSLDLSGKYIVPPFGEAHTHNLCSEYGVSSMIDQYIEEGIFYIQVLGGSHEGRLAVARYLEDTPLDVSYANGGITCTLGHPFTIYEPLAMGIHDPAEKRKRGADIRKSRLAEQDAYWFFDSIEEVDKQWAKLRSTNPDNIKIMILDAAHYDSLYANKRMLGGKGLSKIVAEYVVRKAKKDEYRVFAHIETADDFDFALDIGVDVIAHLPGYAWNGNDDEKAKFELSTETIQKAAQQQVALISTSSLSMNYLRTYVDGLPTISRQTLDRVTQYQRRVLDQLHQAGVPIAIGSDQYGKSLFVEVDYLYQHDILDKQRLLKTICETNPQLIFPDRKIGKIADGYEASFLVLDENPLTDLQHLHQIDASFKNGIRINK